MIFLSFPEYHFAFPTGLTTWQSNGIPMKALISSLSTEKVIFSFERGIQICLVVKETQSRYHKRTVEIADVEDDSHLQV